jgi:hypothetical protein
MEPRELVAAAGIGLFALPIFLSDSWLGLISPLLALAATIVIFQVTRDETDDELLGQIARRFRRVTDR